MFSGCQGSFPKGKCDMGKMLTVIFKDNMVKLFKVVSRIVFASGEGAVASSFFSTAPYGVL